MTSEELSSELWDDLEGWNVGWEASEGGDIHKYIRLTDSRCCTAETIILGSNYTPIKYSKNKRRKENMVETSSLGLTQIHI